MSDVETKDMIRMLSFGRIVIGAGAFMAPRRFGRAWTGGPAEETASVMAVRGLGARDVALGLGTLLALEGDGPVRGWLEAQALADASDTVSTLANFGDIPGIRRFVMLATAATACYLGIRLAGEVD
ncbi:MAG: hypothetical protein ACLGHL_01520 [Actinomycetota bacterium]